MCWTEPSLVLEVGCRTRCRPACRRRTAPPRRRGRCRPRGCRRCSLFLIGSQPSPIRTIVSASPPSLVSVTFWPFVSDTGRPLTRLHLAARRLLEPVAAAAADGRGAEAVPRPSGAHSGAWGGGGAGAAGAGLHWGGAGGACGACGRCGRLAGLRGRGQWAGAAGWRPGPRRAVAGGVGRVVHGHPVVGDQVGQPAGVPLPDGAHLPGGVASVELQGHHDQLAVEVDHRELDDRACRTRRPPGPPAARPVRRSCRGRRASVTRRTACTSAGTWAEVDLRPARAVRRRAVRTARPGRSAGCRRRSRRRCGPCRPRSRGGRRGRPAAATSTVSVEVRCGDGCVSTLGQLDHRCSFEVGVPPNLSGPRNLRGAASGTPPAVRRAGTPSAR